MKTLRIIFLGLVAILLVSCAELVPPVSSTFKPDNNTTVLFARLNLEKRVSLGNRIALWLQNLDSKKSVYIYFDQNQPVYAITAEPGRYRLMGAAGIDMTHRVLDRDLFREKGSKGKYYLPFEVRTNSAIYLGDFVGYAKVNLVAEEWAIKSVTNNFDQTTEDFRKTYPNLASLQVFSIFETQP